MGQSQSNTAQDQGAAISRLHPGRGIDPDESREHYLRRQRAHKERQEELRRAHEADAEQRRQRQQRRVTFAGMPPTSPIPRLHLNLRMPPLSRSRTSQRQAGVGEEQGSANGQDGLGQSGECGATATNNPPSSETATSRTSAAAAGEGSSSHQSHRGTASGIDNLGGSLDSGGSFDSGATTASNRLSSTADTATRATPPESSDQGTKDKIDSAHTLGSTAADGAVALTESQLARERIRERAARLANTLRSDRQELHNRNNAYWLQYDSSANSNDEASAQYPYRDYDSDSSDDEYLGHDGPNNPVSQGGRTVYGGYGDGARAPTRGTGDTRTQLERFGVDLWKYFPSYFSSASANSAQSSSATHQTQPQSATADTFRPPATITAQQDPTTGIGNGLGAAERRQTQFQWWRHNHLTAANGRSNSPRASGPHESDIPGAIAAEQAHRSQAPSPYPHGSSLSSPMGDGLLDPISPVHGPEDSEGESGLPSVVTDAEGNRYPVTRDRHGNYVYDDGQGLVLLPFPGGTFALDDDDEDEEGQGPLYDEDEMDVDESDFSASSQAGEFGVSDESNVKRRYSNTAGADQHEHVEIEHYPSDADDEMSDLTDEDPTNPDNFDHGSDSQSSDSGSSFHPDEGDEVMDDSDG